MRCEKRVTETTKMCPNAFALARHVLFGGTRNDTDRARITEHIVNFLFKCNLKVIYFLGDAIYVQNIHPAKKVYILIEPKRHSHLM
jgi:hypothetical protein